MEKFNVKTNDERFSVQQGDYKFVINGETENLEDVILKRRKEEKESALKKYMPIGSIILLKDYSKLLMIIGFNINSNGEIYDYLGCQYPFGVDEIHNTLVFNHNQIKQVFHIGYVNEQEKYFKQQLDSVESNEVTKKLN